MKKIWYAPNKFDTYGKEEINNVVNCLNEGWLAGTGNYTLNFTNFLIMLLFYIGSFLKNYLLFEWPS